MGMYELSDIIEYFNTQIATLNEERIIELYNMISNPELRVNDKDKQWVAYKTQASENNTVLQAICEILEYKSFKCFSEEKKIENAINNTGELFDGLGIVFKPRIPFYILVLDELV